LTNAGQGGNGIAQAGRPLGATALNDAPALGEFWFAVLVDKGRLMVVAGLARFGINRHSETLSGERTACQPAPLFHGLLDQAACFGSTIGRLSRKAWASSPVTMVLLPFFRVRIAP